MKCFRSTRFTTLAVIASCLAIGPQGLFAQARNQKTPVSTVASKHGYTISKETTYFTGPLKKDGTIDFIAAVNEHFAKGVTPENNAARAILPLLNPAAASQKYQDQILRELGVDPANPSSGPQFQEFDQFVREANIPTDVANGQYVPALSRAWTEGEFPDLARWLSENADPLEKISEATRLKRFYVPFVANEENDSLVMVRLEYVQATRGLARAYSIRANLHMADQRWDKAWDDILAIKRLGELSGQGQTLVQELVGLAITGMASDTAKRLIVSADLNAIEWETFLASWETGPIADVAQSLGVSERAMFIQLACQLEEDIALPVPLFDQGQGDVAMAANKLVVSTLRKMLRSSEASLDETLRFANSFYDRMIELSSMDDIQARNEAMDRFNKEVEAEMRIDPDKSVVAQVFFAKPKDPSRQVANVLLAQLLPAIDAVNRAHWRQQASQQVVKLALAARVVQARTGHLPESLRELEPLVEESAFVQPSTGDSIQAISNNRELLIYHWASNRIDDGGDVKGDGAKDWGIRITK